MKSHIKKILLSSSIMICALKLHASPQKVQITNVVAHGTGCPKNSVFIDISPDKQVFTALFEQFQATIDPFDPSIRYADRHKRCDISLKVQVPSGWQFSIFQADYEGW